MTATRKSLAYLFTLLGIPTWVSAEDIATLPSVYVETKREQKASAAENIDGKTLQNKNTTDLKNALTDVANVEVIGVQRARQGNDSVNIRGLSGNRVAMNVDGIALPEAQESKFFTASGMVFGRGQFVETTALKNISISRRSAGNGIGGEVSMQTLSPDDILAGEAKAAYVQAGYNSIDKSYATTGAAAAQAGAWRGMLLGTYRHGNETINRGEVGGSGVTRTKPNPLDYNSRYFLSKHELALNDNHDLSLVGEYLQRNQWTNQLANLTDKSVSDVAKDNIDRVRVSLGHHYQNDTNILQDVDSKLYYQSSQTQNQRDRAGSAYAAYGGIRSDYAQVRDKVWGAQTHWLSRIQGDKISQTWRYGANIAQHDLNNRLISNYDHANKPYANSKRLDATLFGEGDIDFGAWVLSAGLSLHHYRTSPKTGGGYEQQHDDVAPVKGNSKTIAAPHAGVLWQAAPLFQPYIQYARGFKAPSTQQLVTTYGNSFGPSMSYAVVGNPGLKPETANNFEIGIRGHNETWDYAVSAFDNHYQNFIDYVLQAPLPNVLVQYVNVDKARIYGGEVHATWKFMPNWRANAQAGYAKGYTEADGSKSKLNSVLPLKIKLGLAYEREQWGVNAAVTYAAAKKDKDIDTSGTNLANPDNQFFNPTRQYTLLDIGAYWQPNKHLSLHAGVNNVFNQKYWNWADIAYFAPKRNNAAPGDISLNQTNAPAYTAPGRNFNIGVKYQF
ncbi:TonB-dependent hemoglobin/transferrin/lactoferrin family receptor [Stenoxybacter acetivorans]|uniref:TonB-dependent hemoglobin/transferrin/lactoferrin family receptor n=1 Tax=Stenoxybacter acetivorans TaxID=422441 RepID=UPI00056C0CA0|nr:TonB-dependent hemoglobin/transferrin/lactoferrin family receptor [Stenoxybacter acetivorans]